MSARSRQRRKLAQQTRSKAGTSSTSRPVTWIAGGAGLAIALAISAFIVISQLGDEGSAGEPGSGTELSVLNTPDFHSMAVSPQDPDLVLHGHHGGVLRSVDGGRNWTKTNLTGATDDAMGMGFASVDGTAVFAAGHDTFFRSNDAGETWEALSPALPGTDLHGLTTAPDEPGTVYVHVVRFGIFRSADGGVTWEKANQASLPGDVMSLSAGPGGRLYAASPGTGVFRSEDGGKTFALAAGVETPLTVSASATNADVVYAGTQSGLFFSDDGGQSWQARTAPSDGAVMVSAVSPSDPMDLTIVVVGEDGAGRVHRSVDGGVTWISR
jgi:photosystem II stability/assembly factor-like uncharacterized protein